MENIENVEVVKALKAKADLDAKKARAKALKAERDRRYRANKKAKAAAEKLEKVKAADVAKAKADKKANTVNVAKVKNAVRRGRRPGNGQTIKRKIAEFLLNKWVPRREICQHFDIVDNTVRHYISRIANTPGVQMYSQKINNHSSYIIEKLPAQW